MFVDHKLLFVEPIKASYKMPGRNYNVKAACQDFLGVLKLVPNNFDYKD